MTQSPRRSTPPEPDAAIEAPRPPLPVVAPVIRVAKELRRWADVVLEVANNATDISLAVARSSARSGGQQKAVETAGAVLKKARETAGMTTQELGAAINLSDPDLIEQAEKGKIALPFEVVLRLAGILGRHDPASFAMRLTRSYSPGLWQALEDLGVGRLILQAGRERELANIYRANDAARKLSDEDFHAVLAFTKDAFDMGVAFRNREPSPKAVHATKAAAATPAAEKPSAKPAKRAVKTGKAQARKRKAAA